MTVNDYILIGMIVLLIFKKLLVMSGCGKGAAVAGQLEDALQEARDFMIQARAGDLLQIDRAAEVAASKIKGTTAADIKPLIENLVTRSHGTHSGVSFNLDSDGNINVDPSGLAVKLVHKSTKWLKKVF